MELLGWIVWVAFVVWALSCLRIIFKVNAYGESGLDHVLERRVPTFLTFFDGLVGVLVAVVFIVGDINKLHLLWAGPAMFIMILILGRVGFLLGVLRGSSER